MLVEAGRGRALLFLSAWTCSTAPYLLHSSLVSDSMSFSHSGSVSLQQQLAFAADACIAACLEHGSESSR